MDFLQRQVCSSGDVEDDTLAPSMETSSNGLSIAASAAATAPVRAGAVANGHPCVPGVGHNGFHVCKVQVDLTGTRDQFCN